MSANQEVQTAGQNGHLPANSTMTPPELLSMAVQQNADMEKLERLMDLQERWEASQARKAFVSAMNRFKADPPKLKKNKQVKYNNTEYWHATLDHVCEVIGSALSEQGFSFNWKTNQAENGVVRVTCILTHEAGHSEETSLQAMPDNSGGKNTIQAVGSTVTYLQRYTLLAATGMAAEEQDDDGAGAGSEPEEPKGPPTYSEEAFKKNFPKWQELIESGKKTPESVIATVSSKAQLTETQKAAIQRIKPKGETNANS